MRNAGAKRKLPLEIVARVAPQEKNSCYAYSMKHLIILFFLTSSLHASEVIPHVLRIKPGEDPKAVLVKFVQDNKLKAVSVSAAVGSLKKTVLRYANQKDYVKLEGFREVVGLSGTLGATSGSHLHLSVSDAQGQTLGGHLGEGSEVYTTLEVVLLSYPALEFERVVDPKTTFPELNVKKK